MKVYKYLLAGALLISAAAPSMAQSDTKALQAQVTEMIKTKGPDFDKQVKQLYKDNKKDPAALLAIGRAFYNAKDYTNANAFADYALAKDSKYAPAFLLKGDICVSKDDAGGAAENYQQAKYFAPKDPEGYYKYAMILRGRSPQEAVDNLEDLRKQRPDYPVDALAGRIFYQSNIPNRFEKAEEYFNKITDLSKMEDDDISKYAMTEFLLGKRDRSIEVAKAGLQKDSRRAGWNRIVFWNYTDKKDTQNALDYADRLFNKSDSAHITADDYAYYGTALQQAKRWDEAIDAYQKALNDLATDKNAIVQKPTVLKNISDAYNGKGDYDNAVKYLDESLEATENPSFRDYNGLGSLYLDIASKKSEAGDKAGALAAFKNADNVYGKIAEKYPEQANYCNYVRGSINASMDPESKEGLAKPYYNALITSLESKADRSSNETAMLKSAYSYFMVYEINVLKNTTSAKEWASKLLSIDPQNEMAKQVMSFKSR